MLIPLALVVAFKECHDLRGEAERPKENQDILLHNGRVEIGRTQSGRPRASVLAITLKTSDLKRNPDSLLAVNRKELKIKKSRIMAAATTSTTTQVDVKAAIRRFLTIHAVEVFPVSTDRPTSRRRYPGVIHG